MKKLQEGERAPEFSLLDQEGIRVRLKDFSGEKLLLYFYPKADTPGCTRQSCSVSEALPDFGKGVAAVGISPDAPEKQKKFDRKYKLGFPLLADQDHAVAEAYGVWGEKTLYGRKYMGIIRSSFLLDEDGKIVRAWYRISPANTVPWAKKALLD